MLACLLACLLAHIHTCLLAYFLYTYIPTHVRTYLLTYILTYFLTYLLTFLLTSLLAYLLTSSLLTYLFFLLRYLRISPELHLERWLQGLRSEAFRATDGPVQQNGTRPSFWMCAQLLINLHIHVLSYLLSFSRVSTNGPSMNSK